MRIRMKSRKVLGKWWKIIEMKKKKPKKINTVPMNNKKYS